MADRFDKFTERARRVLTLAQEEAQRFNHNYIGTEHLLLGLVREGEGVAAKVLANLGVELNKVRSAVEFIIGRGDRPVTGEIGLTPRAKKVIELADAAGMMTHVHSCGPERALVKVMAEETALTVIDPLEEPPMGDCDLAEIKHLWGGRLTLKGNLHTTRTMLMGTPDDVIAASRKAIDDAAEGGCFILSTGDQCGRDTPFENLRAMIDTARTYGRY